MRQKSTKILNAKTAQISQNSKHKLKRKRRRSTLMTHIYRVLKSIHPELSISKKALQIVNSIIFDIYDKIMKEVSILIKLNNPKTLYSREIQTAVRLLFGGELARHAVSEGVHAVQRFRNYYD